MVQFAGDDQDDADRKAHGAARRRSRDTSTSRTMKLLGRPRRARSSSSRSARPASARPPTPTAKHETWEGWEDAAVPAGPARRLPARLPRPAGRVRLRPGRDLALRALRAGLRAHPHPVRAAHRRRRSRTTGRSSSGPPTSSSPTAARCPASTVTVSPAASCCRRCSAHEVVALFGEVKALFDPDNRMNPGKVVAPEPARLAPAAGHRLRARRADDATSRYPRRRPPVHARPRCAVSASAAAGPRAATTQVMCPSYMVTREEEHSTRGRARLLFEMVARRGHHRRLALDRGPRRARPVPGLQGLQVRLPGQRRHGHLQGRVPRPPLPATGCARAPHYSMGWLPAVGAPRGRAPSAGQRARHARRPRAALVKRARWRRPGAGPPGASPTEPFTRWWRGDVRRRDAPRPGARAGRCCCGPTPSPTPSTRGIARAAVEVLEDAGFEVAGADASRCAAG